MTLYLRDLTQKCTQLRSRCALYATIVIVASSLYGCATSPPPHFYTLNSEGAETDTQHAPQTQAPFYIDVTAVEIPASVARAQLVVTTHSGAVEVKEQHRWLAPLDDQIRAALSEELSAQLYTLDVSQTPYASNRPVYRITLDVQRFKSRRGAQATPDMGGQAIIEAIWSVQRIEKHQKNARAVLTCRASVHESTAPNLQAINQGHRRAIRRIANAISAAIRALDAARIDPALDADDCPITH